MRHARMLTTVLALLSATRLLAADSPEGPLLKAGDRVAIIGDSITEQKQYSVMIESYLRACVPQFQAAVIQLGWSGERAGGFAKRMDNDLMGWKPTVATLCYGMNDGGYQPYNESIGAEYRKQMSAIAERFAGAGVRVVVGSPGVVDSFTWSKDRPDADVAYNQNLATLGSIGREIAQAKGFVFADVHGVMSNTMIRAKAALGDTYAVAGGDGVHPGANGHLCMAYAFLKGLGLDGRIAEIRLAWPEGAKASEGHTIKSAKEGRVEIESTRYPFCFYGDAKDPNAPASILPFLPFQADLNRFTLVVTGLTTPKADVTWGGAAMTFTREQLETGVNLAEAFPDNPFSAPFRKVVDAVAAKQSKETRLIKGMLTSFRGFEEDIAQGDAELVKAFEVIRRKISALLDEAQGGAQAEVRPVTHTLQITPRAE